MSDQSHTVNRRFAADILNVSLRTLDRYVKKNAISATRRGRELYFGEQELLDFKAKLLALAEFEQMQAKKFQKEQASKAEFADVARAQVIEEGSAMETSNFSEIRSRIKESSAEQMLYKGLYEKTDAELAVAREKLSVANYHIGRLEAQVNAMVPQLEYKKQRQELLTLIEDRKRQQEGIQALEQQIRIELFAKRVYAVFLFGMMALLPLLVILRLVA